jgi:hypothetical protein
LAIANELIEAQDGAISVEKPARSGQRVHRDAASGQPEFVTTLNILRRYGNQNRRVDRGRPAIVEAE